jgi:Organic solute transporter Ostalpha
MAIEALAVTVAMYSLIQFYIQTRAHLAPHQPFIKVLAIKLVVFLSFWQSFMISVLTSPTLNILKASPKFGWPDVLVGIPSLLLCIEMAMFAILHLFAFPYKPYTKGVEPLKYSISGEGPTHPDFNTISPKRGGPLGIYALIDAMNPWDLIKAFGRGIRWIFIGRKHREEDLSYKVSSNDLSLEPTRTGDTSYEGPVRLPIAEEFRRSRFGMPNNPEEGAGLIAHAQPQPHSKWGQYTPAKERYDPKTGEEIKPVGVYHSAGSDYTYDPHPGQPVGVGAVSTIYDEDDSPIRYQEQAVHGVVRAYHPQVVQAPNRPQQSATHQTFQGQDSQQEYKDPSQPAQSGPGA